jgi:predicted small lipoprotein YifL
MGPRGRLARLAAALVMAALAATACGADGPTTTPSDAAALGSPGDP